MTITRSVSARSHCLPPLFILVLLLCSSTARAFSPAGEAGNFGRWMGTDAKVSVNSGGLTVGFQKADHPNARVKATTPWDWHLHGLALEISNPNSREVAFHWRLDDVPNGDGKTHCVDGLGSLPPHGHAVCVLPLGVPETTTGSMRGWPPLAGTYPMSIAVRGPFDPTHIYALQVSLDHPRRPASLVIESVQLTPLPVTDNSVDKFGQYTRAEYPGKVHDLAELQRQRVNEAASLKGHPSLPNTDKYGGWTAGPQLAKSGFFRTQRVRGKWWLVTPEGHLFFSAGVNTIGTGDGTKVTGRESMYAWIPDASDPLHKYLDHRSQKFGGTTITGDFLNFYNANLERKYGADWKDAWYDTTLQRLRAWGFNTVGNWSGMFIKNGRVPYVASIYIWGDHKKVSGGWDYWGQMHDPFDPQFAKDIEVCVAQFTKDVKDDPWCLGYFADNELSWSGSDKVRGPLALAYGALSLPADSSPAKQAFIADLKAKYPTVTALNTAWGTGFHSWDDLAPPYKPTGLPDPAMRVDLDKFVGHLSSQYFRLMRQAIKTADPNHLYLGCRFAAFNPTVVTASAPYTDVMSFNVYGYDIDPDKFAFVKQLNKPCIIGEYHFGGLDRGMWSPGLVDGHTQAGRARMYRHYMESLLDDPLFVGCHWFEYGDEPLTGRWDGENYQIGFVSQTDTPYQEMVAAAQAEHRSMYARRYGK